MTELTLLQLQQQNYRQSIDTRVTSHQSQSMAAKQRAEQWFDDNFVGNACIMCSRLGILKLGHGLSMAVMHERRAAWYITVECTSCGHTLFYNAERG